MKTKITGKDLAALNHKKMEMWWNVKSSHNREIVLAHIQQNKPTVTAFTKAQEEVKDDGSDEDIEEQDVV